MKHLHRIFALALCLGLLLTGCAQEPPPETTPTASVPSLPEILALYDAARQTVEAAPALQLAVTLSRNRTVGGQTYTEQITESAAYDQGEDGSLLALVTQELGYGSFQTQYQEFYTGNRAYVSTNGVTFQGDLTADEFLSRHTPALLIDPALYSNVQFQLEGDQTVLHFAGPAALESWATDLPEVQLISAGGTVTLGADGTLLCSTYEAAYTCGDTVYALNVTAAPTLRAGNGLSLPEIPENRVTLDYLDAPRKILQTVGDVYTSQAISANQTSYLYSEFAPLVRTQNTQLDICGTGDHLQARTHYDVTVVDYSNTPQYTSELQTYAGGILSTVVNDGEAHNTAQDTDKIRMTYEDAVLSPVLTLDLIAGAQALVKGTTLQIYFTGNDLFAQNLCDGLYATFLKIDLDQYYSFTNNTADGYLHIDLTTGLPVAMGYCVSRTHQCGNVPHVLQYKLEQTITLSSPTAQDAIFGPTTEN